MAGTIKLSDEKFMDDIREFLGWCPLYEGVIAERDADAPAVPIRFMRQMSQRNHKCKYCNVNRAGEHQDFCPSNIPMEVPRHGISKQANLT